MGKVTFDEGYWERRWDRGHGRTPGSRLPPNPYLAAETHHLTPGTALDAGCGEGAEAIWLAENGWTVTGADLSHTALRAAAERAHAAHVGERLAWLQTDLTEWEPQQRFDLVVTSYAHATTGQLALYERIGRWVAPGGTLLIVGHLHDADAAADHHHPQGATATLRDIVGLFTSSAWTVETARESVRIVTGPDARSLALNDVIVRARRRP